MVAPVFFEVALSTYDAMRSQNNHYIYPMAGFLLFSAALGMARLGKYLKPKRLQETVTVMLLICLMQLKYSEADTIQSIIHSESWTNRRCLEELIEVIPPQAPVYGRDPFFTRLATRPEIWEEPDLTKYPVPGWAVRPGTEAPPPGYEVVRQSCGFQVLKSRDR